MYRIEYDEDRLRRLCRPGTQRDTNPSLSSNVALRELSFFFLGGLPERVVDDDLTESQVNYKIVSALEQKLPGAMMYDKESAFRAEGKVRLAELRTGEFFKVGNEVFKKTDAAPLYSSEIAVKRKQTNAIRISDGRPHIISSMVWVTQLTEDEVHFYVNKQVEVDISGLPKPAVLLALWRASRSQGMSFLGYEGPMTIETATKAVEEHTHTQEDGTVTCYFDYLNGRVMKIDIGSDTINARLYDRDNGAGTAYRAIEKLRNGIGISAVELSQMYPEQAVLAESTLIGIDSALDTLPPKVKPIYLLKLVAEVLQRPNRRDDNLDSILTKVQNYLDEVDALSVREENSDEN